MNDFRPTHMKIIKSLIPHFSLILMALSGISCNSDIYGTGPATQRGSVAGGITGAALGAIVGNQSGRPLEGAALGGLIGAAAGSALGNANDQENGYSPPRRYRYIPLLQSFITIITAIDLDHQEDIVLLVLEIHFTSVTEIK